MIPRDPARRGEHHARLPGRTFARRIDCADAAEADGQPGYQLRAAREDDAVRGQPPREQPD